MKYKIGSAVIAGVLALSSGVSHAADRAQTQDSTQDKEHAQYVQTKLAEGIVSVAAMAVGQQKSREYQDEKIELLHLVDSNKYSLKKMSDSDQPLSNWLDTHSQEWQSLHDHEARLDAQINKANHRLRMMSKAKDPELYAKIENEIRSLKGELEKRYFETKILERRNKTLAIWARTGQGDIHLTDQERKSIKSFYKMKRSMIVETTDLTKKAAIAELKSVASLVTYVPAVIVAGTTVKDMVTSTKRMEKAQASSQSPAIAIERSQGAVSEAAR